MLQSSIWQKSNYGDKAQPCGWPHRNGLICLCSKRYGYRIQPQFTNLYHFHVADTPLDLSISVYSFVFCAQPYLCSRSSLKLKKKKKNNSPFLLSHLGPFLTINTFPQNSGPRGSLVFWEKKNKLHFLEQFEIHSKIEHRVSIYPLPHAGQPLPHHSTSVTVDELTPYYNPKSVVYSRVYALCTFYGFWQMYNDLYPLLQDHTEECHCLKIPSALPIYPTLFP